MRWDLEGDFFWYLRRRVHENHRHVHHDQYLLDHFHVRVRVRKGAFEMKMFLLWGRRCSRFEREEK
jgi:hypothetical protein